MVKLAETPAKLSALETTFRGQNTWIFSRFLTQLYNKKLATVGNLFQEVFGSVSDDEWRKILITSMSHRVIDSVEFPSFVDDNLQASIHGNFGENSVNEAFAFYNFVKSKTYGLIDNRQEGFFLDFAAGGDVSVPISTRFSAEENVRLRAKFIILFARTVL